MRRLAATTATTLLAAIPLIGAGATPAAAGEAGSPWTPYRSSDVTVTAARSTCAFDVRISVVQDDEEYRTTQTYADGTPKEQLFRGTLVERYTNLSTGTSVVRDLSATAVFAYNPDGSPASLTSLKGPFGATMPAGSTPDTGLFVLSGKGTSVTFNADGTRSYTLGRHGTAENVCDAID